jgi:uncharacterized BrkB/YihY/UPF0761 family membrane protein
MSLHRKDLAWKNSDVLRIHDSKDDIYIYIYLQYIYIYLHDYICIIFIYIYSDHNKSSDIHTLSYGGFLSHGGTPNHPSH